MIALDASVGAALVLNEVPVAPRAWKRIEREDVLVVPGHFDLEVMSAIRGHERATRLDQTQAESALRALIDLKVVRWPNSDLRRAIFAKRHNLSIYDAAYVALAEALEIPLLTADAKLAGAPHPRARIELV